MQAIHKAMGQDLPSNAPLVNRVHVLLQSHIVSTHDWIMQEVNQAWRVCISIPASDDRDV